MKHTVHDQIYRKQTLKSYIFKSVVIHEEQTRSKLSDSVFFINDPHAL